MNAKQAMRKAKKLAELETAKQAQEQKERDYPLFQFQNYQDSTEIMMQERFEWLAE